MADEHNWVSGQPDKYATKPSANIRTVGTDNAERMLNNAQPNTGRVFNTPLGRIQLTPTETRKFDSLPEELQVAYLKWIATNRQKNQGQIQSQSAPSAVNSNNKPTGMSQTDVPVQDMGSGPMPGEAGYQSDTPPGMPPDKPKKKSKLPLILGILLGIIVLAIGSLFVYKKFIYKAPLVAEEVDYAKSGQRVYENLANKLVNYNATDIDNFVGTSNGDSYLAQEWAHVNEQELREQFIKAVCSKVTFEYPMINQRSTTGVEMPELPQIVSPMLHGEQPTVAIPDYTTITNKMETDREYINNLFRKAGYKTTDYTFDDEMTDLFISYFLAMDVIPTIKIPIDTPIDISNMTVVSDAGLDKMLFGSDEFHAMLAKFSQCCLGFTGYQESIEMIEVEEVNPEYTAWLEKFLPEFEKSGGKYDKQTNTFTVATAPTEDENWGIVYKDEAKTEVDTYWVKVDGTQVNAPTYMIKTSKEQTNKVELDWIEETGIPYNWIGVYYLQNDYKGRGSTVTRFGDGTVAKPAGIGTTLVTHVYGNDLKYHDVRVSVIGYWTGQDAIDYIEKMSSKNRGFSAESITQFICWEITVENLEDSTFTFDSEMCLCDNKENVAIKTGMLYGFTNDDITVGPYEKVTINDWYSSTEISQKYVAWGKTFRRSYPMIYFNILAGQGNVPPYSAYKQYTGKVEDAFKKGE